MDAIFPQQLQKVHGIRWYNSQDLLHEINCKTGNKEMHMDVFLHLMDAVRRKSHENLRTNIWFLLHYNAPAHRSVLVKDFLAKYNVVTLEYPPFSPDLSPSDFCLFPRHKSALKRRNFCDATQIIKNATWELKRLSRIAFQECFQHIYSRWQKCLVAQWDDLEEMTLK